jgi:hypothetical protein
LFVIWSLFGLTALVGCGGESNIGEVGGTVTLDGNPLPDALVTFSPKSGAGSPSAGRTDTSGNYSLSYTRDISGAELGEHIVRITTYQAGDPDAEPPTASVPEKVPLKYNHKSELTREVKPGTNDIDLELKSDGPVIQPDVLEKIEAQRERDCG